MSSRGLVAEISDRDLIPLLPCVLCVVIVFAVCQFLSTNPQIVKPFILHGANKSNFVLDNLSARVFQLNAIAGVLFYKQKFKFSRKKANDLVEIRRKSVRKLGKVGENQSQREIYLKCLNEA